MTPSATRSGPASSTRWLRGLWEYYREYTHSAVHAAAVAALTIFGLLVFIDPLFAALAIASYVCPPIVLYALDADVGTSSRRPEPAEGRASVERSSRGGARGGPESVARGADFEGDTDTEAAGDTDTDSDDGDTDTDGDDGDTDTDSDDGDTDSDAVEPRSEGG